MKPHKYIPLLNPIPALGVDSLISNGAMKLSRFCHILSRGNVGVVFHSLSMYPIFFSASLLPFVEGLKYGRSQKSVSISSEEELFVGLAKAKMLIDDKLNEEDVLKDLVGAHLGLPIISVLYLVMTDRCNFACSYCVVENRFQNKRGNINLNKSSIHKAIHLFIKYLDKGTSIPRIILYGGEPLLNYGGVKEAITLIRTEIMQGTLPAKTEIQLITNGSLLDDEKAKWLADKDVLISVSIDGRDKSHDSNRKFVNGQNTFSQAIQGYKTLQRHGIKPSISCTISEQNVEEIVEDVKWFIEELTPSGIGFNIRTDTPGQPPTSEAFIQKTTESLTACYDLLRSTGIGEDRVSRKAKALASGNIWFKDCAGCGNQIVISPSGRIGVCQAYTATEEHFPAHVDTDVDKFNPITDPIFIEWSNRSPLNMPSCYSCIALGNCGGGCPACAELVWGSIWAVDKRFCTYSKSALEWLIWDIYDQHVT